jgi:hypothetical protein
MSTEKLLNEEIEKKRKAEEEEAKLAKSKLDFKKRKQQELEEVDPSAESFFMRKQKQQATQQHEKPSVVPIKQAKLPISEVGQSKSLKEMIDKILTRIDKDKKLIALGDSNSQMIMKNMKPFLSVTPEKITLMVTPDEDNIKTLIEAGKAAYGDKVILICFEPDKKEFMQAQAKKHGVPFADSPEKLAELRAKQDGKQADNNLPLEPPHVTEDREKALKKEVMDRLVKKTLERAANNKVSKNDKAEAKEEAKEKHVRFADDEKPNEEEARFRPS